MTESILFSPPSSLLEGVFWLPCPKNLPLTNLLFLSRRDHSVLRAALPPKNEHVLLLRMTPTQRQLYSTFMDELTHRRTIPNPLKAFAVCCKIWNHPDNLFNHLSEFGASVYFCSFWEPGFIYDLGVGLFHIGLFFVLLQAFMIVRNTLWCCWTFVILKARTFFF